MLIVVAPALIAASTRRQRKSGSERPASSGENSTSSVYSRAHFTAFTACSSTCSGAMRSFICMWIGELAIKVCTRPEPAPSSASPARRTSDSLARARAHTVLPWIAWAIALTAAKSPFDEAGKPASITSTFSRSSCLAMRIFSSRVIDAPGLCSPSRRVVSKMINRSGMGHLQAGRTGMIPPPGLTGRGAHNKKGVDYLRAGRSSSRPPRRAIRERLDKRTRKLLTAQTISRFRSVRNGRPIGWHNRPRHADRPRSTRALPAVNTTGTLRQAGLLVCAMLVAGIVSAFVLKQDVNWDLQNYHFYNAWAFVHQRLGWDLGPAQLQTYHNPLLDLPFYAMVAADWPPRLISFVMGLPAGIGAFFLGKILLVLFENTPRRERWLYAAIAFLIGMTASAAVSQLGTTLNEWQGAALVMIALWLVLKRVAQGATGWRTLVAAGLLCGVASGLKLTAAMYAVGLCAALLLQRPVLWLGVRQAFAFGIAVLVGVALTGGPWMWTLYTHFGNPLFPYFNDVFHSPWWDEARPFVAPYGPHTLLDWLTLPLHFFGSTASFVGELEFRDLRLALLYVFAIAALIAWVARQIRSREEIVGSPDLCAAWRALAVFSCVSV